jgi:hypothetical protein
MVGATKDPPATGTSYGPIHGAAQWRKRLRREFQRVGAVPVSVYLDGQRGVAHLRFAERADRVDVNVHEALKQLRSLPDRAGLEATLTALGHTQRHT